MPRRLALSMLVAAFCLAVPAAASGKLRDRDHDRLPDKWEKRYHFPIKKRSGKRDPDRDRLTNRREYRAHTHPRRRDTDRDGFGDGAEIRRGTDPRNPVAHGKVRDRDDDRLPDRWEKRFHFPIKKRSGRRDPDRDRLINRREYRVHTHPRRRDTDGDGLNDRAELVRYKTNPRRADTDGDGLNDRAELIRYKTNPRRADTDGDGFSDGAEITAGTGPRDRASHPRRPAAGGCTGTRNTPGGPDPWGGCFPGPANTGVPAGTNLTPYTGPCTITAANTVIDSKTVNCNLTVNATGVQVRNSYINGITNTNGSATYTDTTIDAGPVNASFNNGPRALNGQNWTAVRVEAFRGISGGWCDNCRLEDSWIHGQDPDEGGEAHQSGIRMDQNSIIRHNTVRCDAPSIGNSGCSGDLTGYGDFQPVRNNLIERNLFLWSTGATCAYGGSTNSKPYPDGSNNVFRDNIFQRGPGNRGAGAQGECGNWTAILDMDAGQRGNQWVNNRWDTGGLIPAGG